MIRPKVEDTVFSGQVQVNKPGFYARKGPHEPLVESVNYDCWDSSSET